MHFLRNSSYIGTPKALHTKEYSANSIIGGSAYEWYIQYRNAFANWQQLKEALKRQFTTPLTPFMAVAKLASRRQGREETAMDYIASVLRDFDALSIYGEQERISIVQNGLAPRLRSLVIGKTWHSVQEMDLHLRTIEASDELYRETGPNNTAKAFVPRRSVQALTQEEDSISEYEKEGCEESDEQESTGCQVIQSKPYTRRYESDDKSKNFSNGNRAVDDHKIRPTEKSSEAIISKDACFNCGSSSHRFRNCDKPVVRAFCFRCGKKDVITPKCDCGPKNLRAVAYCHQTISDGYEREES